MPLPDAHYVLPAFVEQVVSTHLHGPMLLDWFDSVHLMLSRERAEVATPLSAALDAETREAVRLPVSHEPDAGYLLCGWCLVNRRLDPRCTAIEFVEVPAALRGRGMGRALLGLLAAHVRGGEALLPADPRADSLDFWLE